MRKYNRVLLALALTGASAAAVACGDDDDTSTAPVDGGGSDDDGGTAKPDGGTSDGGTGGGGGDGGGAVVEEDDCPEHPNVTSEAEFCVISASKSSPMTEDLSLAPVKGKTLVLSGPVFVGEDVGGGATPDASKKAVTLTIAAGTTLVAETTDTFIVVNRGSKIIANGEPDAPIVFTSGAADPKPGDWGGIQIHGRSLHNRGVDIQGEADTGLYAGPDAEDNSGSIRYVRIEFGGGLVDAENEFNGLTLAGVGSGTTIDHVHIHAVDDDGIEFFGGTVNAKYIVVTAKGDDGIDWTSGYTGKIQFAIVQQWDYSSSSDPRGIEADNDSNAPTQEPISSPILSNITLIGNSAVTAASNAEGAMLRRGTYGQLHNTLIVDWKNACVRVDGAESQAAAGDQLVMANGRINCATNFHDAASEGVFDSANGNEELSSADVLEDPSSTTAPNFAPKANSGLLTGGEAPADSFFEEVSFIGAIGEDDWTKEGSWVKVTPFGG